MRQFHVKIDGKVVGPLEIAAIKQLAIDGTLGRDDLIRKVGSEKWHHARKVAGLEFAELDEEPEGEEEAVKPPALTKRGIPTTTIWGVVVVLLVAGMLAANLRLTSQLGELQKRFASVQRQLDEIKSDEPIRWEYKISSPSDLLFDIEMSRMGREGWELVTARRATGAVDQVSYEMIFKRQK